MEQSKINVVIVDDNKEFCNILKDYLSLEECINIYGIAHDGVAALKLVEEKKPDLIILDIIMPHLDGIGVLENLNKMKLNPQPKVIILSAVGQDQVTQSAISLGAEYYVIKPFDMRMFIDRIKQIYNENYQWSSPKVTTHNYVKVDTVESIEKIADKSSDLEQQITDIILRIGIPAHIRGYKFIREAISMVVNDMNMLSSITKELYPSIAEKFHTTPSRVERSIRHAIEVAWSRGHVEILNDIFGHTINNAKGKPTNGEFIALLSDRLRLKNRAS